MQTNANTAHTYHKTLSLINTFLEKSDAVFWEFFSNFEDSFEQRFMIKFKNREMMFLFTFVFPTFFSWMQPLRNN